jgi:hypothetical protein
MMAGLGDHAVAETVASPTHARIRHSGLRVLRGLQGAERALLLDCWTQLWVGAVRAHQAVMRAEALTVPPGVGDEIVWTIDAL